MPLDFPCFVLTSQGYFLSIPFKGTMLTYYLSNLKYVSLHSCSQNLAGLHDLILWIFFSLNFGAMLEELRLWGTL